MYTKSPNTTEQKKTERLGRVKKEAEFLRLSVDFERKKLEDIEVKLKRFSGNDEEYEKLLNERRRSKIKLALLENGGKRNEWFLPFDTNEYKIETVLRAFQIVDIEQKKNLLKARPGDIVYIYVDNGYINSLKYKGMVLDTEKMDGLKDDSAFRKSGAKPEGPCMEIAVFREYDLNGKQIMDLDYGSLKFNGLNNLKPYLLRGRLKEYINECDEQHRFLKELNSGICLTDFPADIEEL